MHNDNSATLFDEDAKLINTEEWLLQMEFAASRDSEIKALAAKRSDLIKDVLKSILPDVDDLRFRDSNNIAKPVPILEFKTPYGWVGLKELSYGYKTMVAWIVDVAARMFSKYPDSDNPLEEPVVILVDEIDLHLHPKWQRQIFDFLEERFPRAQFVVTAHSPLIVQSAPKDANIIVLRKEQQGDEYVVKIENDHNYVRNWRVDQILASDLFDNVGIRNEEVEQQMQERTTLLQKDVLTDDEKVRLEELNAISDSLPTANNPIDIEAMDIIRRASVYFKNNSSGNDQNQ
jgi:predicted ATP-binding protein involved in virulence